MLVLSPVINNMLLFICYFFQIHIDFYNTYPEALKIQETFPPLRERICILVQRRKTRDEFRGTLENLNKAASEDIRNLGAFLGLVNLINVHNVKTQTSTIRPNLSEMRHNFIVHISSICHMDAKLKKLIDIKEENCSPFQPLIFAIGEDLLRVTQYCVPFNGGRYYFDTIIEAVGFCFKLSWVLDLSYNLEVALVWKYIQIACFKLYSNKTDKRKNGDIPHIVSQLVSDIANV